MTKVLIVGGVAGGATAAARIRRLDENAEIVIFERGGYVSFANCGLPYHLSGVIANRDDLLLQTPEGFYDRYRVEVRVMQEVLSIDRKAKTVQVKNLSTGETYDESYDKLLLSPGAKPTMPEADDNAKSQIFAMHTLADMDKVIAFIEASKAKNAVVIGGGFIGLETAENLKERGLKVSLLQRSAQVMPPLDADMASLVHTKLRENGIRLMLNSPIQSISKADGNNATKADGSGAKTNDAKTNSATKVDASDAKTNSATKVDVGDAKTNSAVKTADSSTNDDAFGNGTGEDAFGELTITLQNGKTMNADFIIAAIGVKPLSTLAVNAGLEVADSGGIVVDEHMLTTDPNIYAVGDAIENTDIVTGAHRVVALAGPANKQARIAADNICGIPSVYKGAQASAIIKVFDQTVATTGINEKVAKSQNLNYDKVYLFAGDHAGYYPDAKDMLIKLLFEKPSGRILGAQIVGKTGVDKRADILATAIRGNLTAHDLTELEVCYAPPYASAKDPINMLGLVIENLLDGLVKQYHWNEVDELPRDGSVSLVDVRTPVGYERDHIDGFINIPVDDLRGRIGELDPNKPVYLHCHSGLRSYVAARILMQNGFKDVAHMNGGFLLYDTMAQA